MSSPKVNSALAISCSGGAPASAAGIREGERVYISEVTVHDGALSKWFGGIERLASKFSSRGGVVLSDDVGGRFSDYATQMSLSDIDRATGKPNLVLALDWHRELDALKLIGYGKAVDKAQLKFGDNLVESEPDGRGNQRYRINWPEIAPRHRAYLLLLLGMCAKNTTMSVIQGWMSSMNRSNSQVKRGGLHAVTAGYDQMVARGKINDR